MCEIRACFWTLAFLVAGQATHVCAGQLSDNPPVAREIQLRTDYLRGSEIHPPNRFDVVSVVKSRSGCTLRFWGGKRHSKAIWREKYRDLSQGECESVWDLIDRRSVDTFRSADRNEVSKHSLRYQLVISWETRPGKPMKDSSRFSRIHWNDKINEDEYSKVRLLVEKLQSLKKLLASSQRFPRPKEKEIAAARKTVPSKFSGIRGHVAHPRGVPWDWLTVYPITVIVLDERQTRVASIETDDKGHFEVQLQPGTYTVCPGSCTDRFLKAGMKTAVVEAGSLTIINLYFDSGIR